MSLPIGALPNMTTAQLFLNTPKSQRVEKVPLSNYNQIVGDKANWPNETISIHPTFNVSPNRQPAIDSILWHGVRRPDHWCCELLFGFYFGTREKHSGKFCVEICGELDFDEK